VAAEEGAGVSDDSICVGCRDAAPLPNGTPRRCSFSRDGRFNADGLNCATFDALNEWTQRQGCQNETWHDGQAVQVFASGGKFLIVGRYHSKPYRTEVCVVIEDDKVNAAPTFAEVAPFLEGRA
jgi:hypothetical protein